MSLLFLLGSSCHPREGLAIPPDLSYFFPLTTSSFAIRVVALNFPYLAGTMAFLSWSFNFREIMPDNRFEKSCQKKLAMILSKEMGQRLREWHKTQHFTL